jgi:hypothetical protein
MPNKINSMRKGKAGEVEFCKWLDKYLPDLSYDKKTERNYNQSDGHSADVITSVFIFEVKRCQKLLLSQWWDQVSKAQAHNPSLIPIVAFRQNRMDWKFMVPFLEDYYCIIEYDAFLEYAKNIIN